MSVIPEIILQRVIIQGIRAVRKDSRMIDTIFRHLHQDQLAAVRKFLLETSIDFSINYPRKDLRVPALVLLLKNEVEAQTFLGDVMGDGSHPYVPDQELTIDTLGGHAASTTDSSGLPRKLFGGIEIDAQEGASTAVFAEDQTEMVEYLQKNPVGSMRLYVVKGAGAGFVYDVARIRNNSLDIIGTFELNLDETSVIDLRVPDDPELAVGEPSRVYQPGPSLIKKGVNYEVTYHLQVLAEQQDQVIYLYSFVKSLILSQRVFLESQGIQVLRLGGSDFAPRSEYLPDQIFQRQMTLTFTYPFSFIEEQETFSAIAIDILAEPTANPVEDILQGYPITLTIS